MEPTGAVSKEARSAQPADGAVESVSVAANGWPDIRWLLDHKVELPDAVVGYVERPELEHQCWPLERRLTVLQAPGGFGKTALMAQCCRRLRDQGTCVAWLAFDEDDGPTAVAAYLAQALGRAGLDTPDLDPDNHDSLAGLELEADNEAAYRINLLVRAIQRHRSPCVLALDEVERLTNPDAVAVLNALLSAAPRNLHLIMAFRERPPGLDIAMFLLEGHGATVGTEDLRFSPPEIARFFETKLSRRELATVAANSAGWPIALRLYRNALQAGTPAGELSGDSETAAAWIESRLWRGLSVEERDFVLDIALFDWMDPELIDEATGRDQSARRIASMPSLTGLLQTSSGAGSTMRLHPLIQEYCAAKRFEENPERFRAIHAGIARTLARLGRVVDALRHAAEAGDRHLVGELAEDAGGVKLWMTSGFNALRAVDGWLTQEVVSARPRLALVRCAVLAMSGDMENARQVYQAAAIQSAGFTRNPDGEEDQALHLDHLLILGLMLVCGCSRLDSYAPLISAATGVARDAELEAVSRGWLRHGLALALNEMTEFDRAAAWTDAARADLGRNTPFLSPHLDYQSGQAAMAQGRPKEAAYWYDRGLTGARGGQLADTAVEMVGEILKTELAFERDARTGRQRTTLPSPRLLGECGAWLDIYAASTGIAVEQALLEGDTSRALAVVQAAREFATATERVAFVRFLAATRVSVLVAAGNNDEAMLAWKTDDLPDSVAGCLDLKAQRWREVEAIASARLRLFIACGEFDAARELAGQLRDVARNRRLLRTLMRASLSRSAWSGLPATAIGPSTI